MQERFFVPTDIEITDEHHAKALTKAREIVGKLEGIRKELGLPADQLPVVAAQYSIALNTILFREEQAKYEREDKEYQERMKANPDLMPMPRRRPGLLY